MNTIVANIEQHEDEMSIEDFCEWRRENPFTGSFTDQELHNSHQAFLDIKYNRKQVNE